MYIQQLLIQGKKASLQVRQLNNPVSQGVCSKDNCGFTMYIIISFDILTHTREVRAYVSSWHFLEISPVAHKPCCRRKRWCFLEVDYQIMFWELSSIANEAKNFSEQVFANCFNFSCLSFCWNHKQVMVFPWRSRAFEWNVLFESETRNKHFTNVLLRTQS